MIELFVENSFGHFIGQYYLLGPQNQATGNTQQESWVSLLLR